MNNRVWLYCRLACNDGISLERQVEVIKEFAIQKGLKVIGITSEYGSGLDFEREGLTEIMEVAQSKKSDMILMRDMSRIGRDDVKLIRYVDEIEKYVKLKTIGNFDNQDDEFEPFRKLIKAYEKRARLSTKQSNS